MGESKGHFTMPSRNVLLLAAVIVAVLAVGALWFATLQAEWQADRRAACEKWQADYHARSLLYFVSERPLAQMRANRPEGCEVRG